MNGRTVWILVLAGLLVMAAVVTWLVTRAPGAGEPPELSATPANPAGNAQVSSDVNPAPAPASPDTQAERVTIGKLFDYRDRYAGRTVIVRGKIVTQCVVRGCWFILDDGTGSLLVQLVEKALERVLPRGSIGKEIEVRGVFQAAPRLVLVVDDPVGLVWK